MGLSSVTITRAAGNFSTNVAAPSKALVVGPCSLGTVGTKYTYAQPTDIITNLGYGPAPTAAEIMLADNGGSVDIIPANVSIAGYTANLVSSSNVPVTLSGTPLDTYAFIANVTKTGTTSSVIATTGYALFQYSLDGGQNFTQNLPLSGTFVVPSTGLTLSFGAGSYPSGMSFSFNAYAPQMASADLTNALNAFTGSITQPTMILVANDTQSATSGSVLFTTLDAGLTTLGGPSGFGIFTVGVLPTGGANGVTSGPIGAFSTVASSQGNVCIAVAERARRQVPAPFPGYGNPQLPFAYAVASRMQGTPPSTNPASLQQGPMVGWSSPTYDEFVNGEVYQDALLGAPRSAKGYPGVFLQQGVLKTTQQGYTYVQWGRVIMVASQILNTALQKYMNTAVRVKKDGTGAIDPRDANRIEQDVNAQLNAGIMQQQTSEGFQGWASSVQFVVNRTNNILTTSQLQGTCVIIPLANVANIAVQLTFGTTVSPATS